jgi:hypothetical protein
MGKVFRVLAVIVCFLFLFASFLISHYLRKDIGVMILMAMAFGIYAVTGKSDKKALNRPLRRLDGFFVGIIVFFLLLAAVYFSPYFHPR